MPLQFEWSYHVESDELARGKVSGLSEELKNTVKAFSSQPEQIILFLPARKVLITEVAIPHKQRKYADNIVPFLIEDLLVEAVTEYHISYTIFPSDSNLVQVAAINRGWLTEVIRECESTGIRVHEAYTEFEFTDRPAASIILLCEGERVWMRTPTEAVCIEKQAFPDVFHLVKAQAAEHVLQIDSYIHKEVDIEQRQWLKQLANNNTAIAFVEHTIDGVFSLLLSRYFASAKSGWLNIMQREFKPADHKQKSVPIKKMALVLCLWLLAVLLINIFQLAYYYSESANYRRKSEHLYSQLFPQDTKLIDPRKQMEMQY